jgi:nicotinamide-nucleotide amidase
VAEFSGLELELRQACLDKLVAYLNAKGRELTETNKRQAFIPKGADIIANDLGTADAFVAPFTNARHSGKILTLPGVPREMRALLDAAMPQVCSELFTVSSQRSEVVLQIFGLPESEIGERIERLNLSDKIIVAYRPHFPTVAVELITRDVELLRGTKEKVVAALGGENHIFAYGRGQTMAATVGALMCEHGLSFAVAESCTGGLIAHRIVSEPGSSAYFKAWSRDLQQRIKDSTLGSK